MILQQLDLGLMEHAEEIGDDGGFAGMSSEASAELVESGGYRISAQISALRLEDCRIALVSREHRPFETTENGKRNGRLLLLPLTWNELISEVQQEAVYKHSIFNFGQVRVDLTSMEVAREHVAITLTSMEFKVLRFFVLHPNRVISRDELLNQVWGYDNYPCTRTVDNHLLRLRQKLEADPANPVHFKTVHSVGYKFVPEPKRHKSQE